MLTVSDDIGQPECVIGLIKFEDFLFHHGLGDVLGIRFDRRVQRNEFAKLPAVCHFVIQDGEQMFQKTEVNLSNLLSSVYCWLHLRLAWTLSARCRPAARSCVSSP
jgi:hypothetical protein